MSRHSRKLLEAEKRRSGVDESYALPGDGHLKADHAFPSALSRSPREARETSGATAHSPNRKARRKHTEHRTLCRSGESHPRWGSADRRECEGEGEGACVEPLPHARVSRKHPGPASSSATVSPLPKRDRAECSPSPVSHASARYAAPPVAVPVSVASRRHTNLQSPPLPAAVSPRPFSLASRILSESPRSTATTTPTLTPFAVDRHVPSCQPLPPPEILTSLTAPQRSPTGQSFGGETVSPQYTNGHREMYMRRDEISGFVNPGSDCYACSVLTLLLRSAVFAHALRSAPVTRVRSEVDEEETKRTEYREGEEHLASEFYLDPVMRPRVYRDERLHKSIHDVLSVYSKLLERPEVIKEGLDMSALRKLFSHTFFSGDQEDAHEFFVVLMAKLEEEAIEVLRSQELLRGYNANHNENNDIENEADKLFRDCNEYFSDEGATAERDSTFYSKAEEEEEEYPNDKEKDFDKNRWYGTNCSDRTGTTRTSTSAHVGEEDDTHTATATGNHLGPNASTFRSGIPIEPSCIWINALIQGKILNIIRCRNRNCGHEIVTEEPYVNLSVNLLKPSTMIPTSSVSFTSSPLRAMQDGQTVDTARNSTGAHTPPPQPLPLLESTPLTPPDPQEMDFHDVQALLENSLRFGPLDAYVCDACGSSRHQHQGGCLSGTAPPILIVQVNRFAASYDAATGTVIVSKDKTPIRVNDELTLYSLSSDGQYDRENKRLTANVWNAEQRAQRKEDSALVKATRCRYRLQGVVLHLGSTLHAGHYVTEFAIDPSQRVNGTVRENAGRGEGNASKRTWKLADDSIVSILSDETVRKRRGHSSNSYLLLYEKIEDEEMMAPVWRVLPCEAKLSSGTETWE